MTTKFLKLELRPDASGVVMSESNLEEVRQKMYAAINDNVPQKARESARAQADEIVAEILKNGPHAISAKSIISAIDTALEALEGLPAGVRAIAQSLGTPSHIFELGSARTELIAAMGFLEMAKTALEEYLTCDHCKPAAAPKKPQGPLS